MDNVHHSFSVKTNPRAFGRNKSEVSWVKVGHILSILLHWLLFLLLLVLNSVAYEPC